METLELLPVELIDHIISLLTKPDLLSLRLTGKRLSGLATIIAFSSITTRFDEESLDNLRKISESRSLACHVKYFEYRFVGIYDIRKGPLPPSSTTKRRTWEVLVSNIVYLMGVPW